MMQHLKLFTFFCTINAIFGIGGKIYDLSWNINAETIPWPGTKKFEYTDVVAEEDESGKWFAINEFCVSEHSGTHFDAPYHFSKNGWKVAEVPLERLFAKVALIDVHEEVEAAGADFLLEVKHLEDYEQQNGEFLNGSILLVKFGWSQFWPNRTLYLGIENDDDPKHFPGLSAAAAEWIKNSGKFYGVGVDTASVDTGVDTEFKAHRILQGSQMFHLENVKLTDDISIPSKGGRMMVAPLKLEEGTGGPARIFVLTD